MFLCRVLLNKSFVESHGVVQEDCCTGLHRIWRIPCSWRASKTTEDRVMNPVVHDNCKFLRMQSKTPASLLFFFPVRKSASKHFKLSCPIPYSLLEVARVGLIS
jgi:hypothetical protein